jgi:hypothetical protein
MFRVIGSKEFDLIFEELKNKAINQNGEAILMVKIISNGIEKLKYDYRYGEHIKSERIPKEYMIKFGVENLWKLNLNSFWRLLYTVKGNEVEVISVILEVLDHKDYDRKFGYKTS